MSTVQAFVVLLQEILFSINTGFVDNKKLALQGKKYRFLSHKDLEINPERAPFLIHKKIQSRYTIMGF